MFYELKDEQMLKCYFSYLIFLYTKNMDHDVNNRDLSIDRLAEHFMNAIKNDKKSKYAKLLRKNAEKNSNWNLLLNKINFFYSTVNEIDFDNLVDIEMDSQ